ncbi:MAG: hypothetical protein ABIS86_15175 [Streptosporangiaceae bacterium]
MKSLLLRGVVVTAAAASLVLPAEQAVAADYQPTDADFAACPTLPTNASRLLWACVSLNIVGGEFKLGNIDQQISPLRINTAIGLLDGKITTIGGGSGGTTAAKAPAGFTIPGLGSLEITIEQAGDLPGTGPIPTSLPLKVHVVHPLVGSKCYVGSDADPISIKPTLTDPRIQLFGSVPVIRAGIGDSTFGVPAATGCGLFTGLINAVIGLPSPAGSNKATLDLVVRIRNYQVGNINPTLAALTK